MAKSQVLVGIFPETEPKHTQKSSFEFLTAYSTVRYVRTRSTIRSSIAAEPCKPSRSHQQQQQQKEKTTKTSTTLLFRAEVGGI